LIEVVVLNQAPIIGGLKVRYFRMNQKNLKNLQENGQLRRVGSKKSGYWEVIDD